MALTEPEVNGFRRNGYVIRICKRDCFGKKVKQFKL